MEITKNLKNKSGVYKIYDYKNRCYIGSSKNLYVRLHNHFSLLRRNKHHSKFMQHVFNKHGEKAFSYKVLEIIPYEEYQLRKKELNYINKNKCVFNSTTPVTYIHSKKMNKQISNTLKRKYTSGEIINPRLNKGRKLNIFDIYGNLVFKNIFVEDFVNKINLSNRSVINNILRGGHFITQKKFIIIEENKNFDDYIKYIFKQKGNRIPVYKIYKNKIEKCSSSSKEKVNHKILNQNLYYYSKQNKCYYTYLGLINRLPFWKEISKIITGQNR